MKVIVLYVGTSLLAPLKQAERDINREYDLDLKIAAHNLGAPLNNDEWATVETELRTADLVFVIHVMDGENANRLISSLDSFHKSQPRAVIVINCLGEIMRRTRMGRLDISRLVAKTGREKTNGDTKLKTLKAAAVVSSWVGRQVKRGNSANRHKNGHGQYLKFIDKLPGLLKFMPTAGGLTDVKHYLNIFCYFLQPTPANIRSMVLYALKEYVPDERLRNATIKIAPLERMPSLAIYHPDAPKLFETFDEYQTWYASSRESRVQSPKSATEPCSVSETLEPDATIGLLLMRPQVVSKTTSHYDALIRSIEAEGLSVIPALSTLMDNREAVRKFFVASGESQAHSRKSRVEDQRPETKDQSRVSQIVSLTGFSFVGGPAMNDSDAAAEFLQQLNRPYRSAVSLDTQTIDAWKGSQTGLNPVQSGMQIAIPEIDGATEPFIYGGLPASGVEPVALVERCTRFARRLKRWNRLRTSPRTDLKLALVLFCFPPNKGNIGTAADLDVFPSVWDTLSRLQEDGYTVELPESPDALRDLLIEGNAGTFASTTNVAYRMPVDEYLQLCPYVDEVEKEWGAAPGNINSFGGELLIQGLQLGNVFLGVQPTFGYEGDPMRLMMARSGAPHHGFMAFYTYLSRVLDVDAAIHVGTHGALEFMPGKQVGLSEECWPDRLIGELPNVYIYSVNNPSEGSIAKRRSYAELISYLTPPIENAGLYRELSTLKDLITGYRQSGQEAEREDLFNSIEEIAERLNFSPNVLISTAL